MVGIDEPAVFLVDQQSKGLFRLLGGAGINDRLDPGLERGYGSDCLVIEDSDHSTTNLQLEKIIVLYQGVQCPYRFSQLKQVILMKIPMSRYQTIDLRVCPGSGTYWIWAGWSFTCSNPLC